MIGRRGYAGRIAIVMMMTLGIRLAGMCAFAPRLGQSCVFVSGAHALGVLLPAQMSSGRLFPSGCSPDFPAPLRQRSQIITGSQQLRAK
jgi:hypothetical protein